MCNVLKEWTTGLQKNFKNYYFLWILVVLTCYILYAHFTVVNSVDSTISRKYVQSIRIESHKIKEDGNSIVNINKFNPDLVKIKKLKLAIKKRDPKTLDVKQEVKRSETFQILYWVKPSHTSHTYGRNYFDIEEGSTAFQECRYQNCMTTSDRSKYNNSDAVIIHLWIAKRNLTQELPIYRPPKQKWIMLLGESPEMASFGESIRGNLSKFNGMFNATWTYSQKSDIWTNYSKGYFIEKSSHLNHSSMNGYINYALEKTHLIAWFVSNCFTKSKRMQYVNKLKQYVNIDIYGKCGDMDCKLDNESYCLNILNDRYKFYLAFENSYCEDYVTEKIWKIMPDLNVVPIVMGAVNYSEILPPHSYIDIGDFKSPKDLADYLKVLNENDYLYNKYFDWKKHYNFVLAESEPCHLCRYLNEHADQVKVYSRLDQFWSAPRLCTSPERFYRNIHRSVWKDKKSPVPKFNIFVWLLAYFTCLLSVLLCILCFIKN